jgi:hypothetical protein
LEAIDTGITRCGATATAAILDDFKAQQSGQQPESRPDPTPGAYYAYSVKDIYFIRQTSVGSASRDWIN